VALAHPLALMPGLKFTRHSKSRARLYKLTIEDAEAVVHGANASEFDRRGNPCYIGRIEGSLIRVVVALDDPDTIITIHPKDV